MITYSLESRYFGFCLHILFTFSVYIFCLHFLFTYFVYFFVNIICLHFLFTYFVLVEYAHGDLSFLISSILLLL